MAKKQGGKSAPKKEEEGAQEVQGQTNVSNQKEKSKLLSKIYREYSRRKFTKYKQQFPRLKESELIAKIIREWEAMSEGEKLSFEKSFVETGGAAFLKDDSGSKSKSKSKSKSNSDEAKKGKVKKEGGKKKSSKKEKPPSPTVRVFIEKDKPADFDKSKKYLDDSEQYNKKKEQNSGSSSVEIVVGGKVKKVKKIQKISNSDKQKSKVQQEYLTFFKYYHSRLEAEHPRWTNTQITSIIRLLWKKKNIKGKKSEKGYNRLNLSLRPMSGRRLYRRQKESSGFLLDQINQMWKALPFESKKFWERKGRGGRAAFSKVPILAMRSLKRTLKSGSEGAVVKQSDNFKWMNSKIQQS